MSMLMSPAELVELTGKTRYSKQAEWFKQHFGFEVTRRDDGSIVIARETFIALDKKRAGLAAGDSAREDYEICFD